MRYIFYFVCFLIAYGSLFPFEFTNNIDDAVLLSFYDSWKGYTSVGDMLGNIVLFIPYGFFGLVAFTKSKASIAIVATLSLFGILLALACQITQLYLPSRAPALVDVYWNILGLVLGIAFAYSYRVRTFVKSVELYSFSFPLVLLGLWGAARLVPFVPSIDVQSYKNALKPLILEPKFDFYEFLFLLSAWLVAAHLFFSLCRARARFLLLVVGVITVSVLEIIIVKNDLSVTDVASSVCALLLWPLLPKSLSKRSLFLVLVMLIGVTSVNLFPFEWRLNDNVFEWVPFAGFLSGSLLISAAVFVQKLFVIGAIFFLLYETGRLSHKAIFVIFSIFLSIEVLQIWLVGHSPEITDPLLVLVCGLFFYRASHIPDKESKSAIETYSTVYETSQPKKASNRPSSSDFTRRCWVILAGGAITLTIMTVFYVVVRLPGVPYNVRELFWLGGSGPDLFFLSLGLLSFGAGAAWVGHVLAKSKKPVLTAPLAAIAISVFFYLCLYMSVTPESISDIVGSSVWVQRLETAGVLGQPGIDFVEYFGADNLRLLTKPFEHVVRVGALFGPVLMLLSVFFAALFKTRWLLLPERKKGLLRYFVIYMGCMLPWFLICKVIAFDFSSTDNLTELIAKDMPWGGGGYLYLLVLIVVLSAVVLSTSFINLTSLKIVSACVFSIVLVPAGWFLLNEGLASNVGKYGLNYSGVDFLLGPDRINLVSSHALFLRWFVVQFSGVMILAIGIHLYLRWVGVSFIHKNETVLSKKAVIPLYKDQVEVNLNASQLNFLNELASLREESLSFIVSSILDNAVREEWISSGELFVDLQNSIADYSGMKTCTVRLEPNHMKWVARIADKRNASRSRVIRKVVENFIGSCN